MSTSAAQWFAVDRDVIEVRGPDARTFLQGQVSQDVLALTEGDSTWSFLLQPSGKVDALIRVWRTGEDVLVVDTDAGYGEATLTRINRFKLRTKADVTVLPWKAVAVRVPLRYRWARWLVGPARTVASTCLAPTRFLPPPPYRAIGPTTNGGGSRPDGRPWGPS